MTGQIWCSRTISTAATIPAAAMTDGPHRDRSTIPQNPAVNGMRCVENMYPISVGGHRDERRRAQVADKRRQLGRVPAVGEPGHDDPDLDQQQDLQDAQRGEQGIAHGLVQGGHQQCVPRERQASDDDRGGHSTVHG